MAVRGLRTLLTTDVQFEFCQMDAESFRKLAPITTLDISWRFGVKPIYYGVSRPDVLNLYLWLLEGVYGEDMQQFLHRSHWFEDELTDPVLRMLDETHWIVDVRKPHPVLPFLRMLKYLPDKQSHSRFLMYVAE